MQLDADRKKVSVFAEKILHNGPPKCECMDCIWQVVPGEDVMRPGPAVAEIIEKLIAEMTPELHLIEAEEFYAGIEQLKMLGGQIHEYELRKEAATEREDHVEAQAITRVVSAIHLRVKALADSL